MLLEILGHDKYVLRARGLLHERGLHFARYPRQVALRVIGRFRIDFEVQIFREAGGGERRQSVLRRRRLGDSPRLVGRFAKPRLVHDQIAGWRQQMLQEPIVGLDRDGRGDDEDGYARRQPEPRPERQPHSDTTVAAGATVAVKK